MNTFIDHTLLKPDCTEAQVRQLCAEASQYQFASVCVLPWWVELCAGLYPVVCTVAGFPLGASVTAVKVREAEEAMRQGAREVDMVASITALKSGNRAAVLEDVRAVTQGVHSRGGLVKVIIETCLLDADEKLVMCDIVTEAGADFIKTSTGFSTGGATLEDVRLLRAHVGPNVQVKASGGIRDRAAAEAMIAAGATRIGTSNGVLIVQ
jgi:deoxyribose-phosphate aldolase